MRPRTTRHRPDRRRAGGRPEPRAGRGLTNVSTPNPKILGVTSANTLSPELAEIERARGGMPLENPQDWASHFGYHTDCVQMVALPKAPPRIRTFVANFQSEGDNEVIGVHVSDGDPSPGGILGAKIPKPFDDGWRVFYTRQHGDNQLYEIIPSPFASGAEHAGDNEDDD